MLRLGKKGGGFLGFLKKTYTKVVKGFSDLPTSTKNWTFAGAIVFFAVLRVQSLHLVSRNVLGDRQVACEGGVAVLLVDRLVGGEATDVDEQLLETATLAQFLEGFRMAVIEVFVADEDVVEDWFGLFQGLSEQVRIHGDVDVAEIDLEGTACRPLQMETLTHVQTLSVVDDYGVLWVYLSTVTFTLR